MPLAQVRVTSALLIVTLSISCEPSDDAEHPAAEAEAAAAAEAYVPAFEPPPLPLGNAVFRVPSTVWVDSTFGVHLLVSVEEWAATLASRLDSAGHAYADTLRVAPIMSARLAGAAFSIQSASEYRQGVDTTSRGEWRWSLRALVPGLHTLIMNINAHIVIEGSEYPFTVLPMQREVTVRAIPRPWYYWFTTTTAGNLTAVAALVIMIGGLVGSAMKRRARA